ncbi:MAG: hypothetical protein ACFFED_13220 [Candidatus Thorarchaeota archaeon]
MRDADNDDSSSTGEQDTLAAFYVIGKKPHEVISGWIALEEGLDEFRETIFEEMEFTLQTTVEKQNEYNLYFVDSKSKNSLSRIDDQSTFETLKKEEGIRLMLLHSSVDTKQVESHPRFHDWLEETDDM